MSNWQESMENKAVINYDAITTNGKLLKEYCQKEIIAVMKNDAYNTGIVHTTKALIKAGINSFAVANLEEAMSIKDIANNVIILNPLSEFELRQISNSNIATITSDVTYINLLEKLISEGCLFNIHIKINVGMNRYGIKQSELNVFGKTSSIFNSMVVGLMTHFPQADEEDLFEHNEQVNKFVNCYQLLKDKFDFKVIHSENSATSVKRDNRLDFCNYVRIGILLYGYNGDETVKLDLYPSVTVKTRVRAIRKVKAGENLGYGTRYVEKDSVIAICSIGYGDGIIGERNKYPVVINGKTYPIVNNISMSHTYVAVDEHVCVGDLVEIYGNNVRFDQIKGVTNSRMMCSLKRGNNEI